MRAVIIDNLGPPATLRVRTVPDPSLSDGRVLVRVAACGVCGRDVLARAGSLSGTRLPMVLGHEISGVVEAVGAGVVGVGIGDRVASTPRQTCHARDFCLEGRDTLCRGARFDGESVWGGYAEFCSIDAQTVVRIPDSVSDEAGAIAACARVSARSPASKSLLANVSLLEAPAAG
jgi:acryloyl-coenzyme A reductase